MKNETLKDNILSILRNDKDAYPESEESYLLASYAIDVGGLLNGLDKKLDYSAYEATSNLLAEHCNFLNPPKPMGFAKQPNPAEDYLSKLWQRQKALLAGKSLDDIEHIHFNISESEKEQFLKTLSIATTQIRSVHEYAIENRIDGNDILHSLQDIFENDHFLEPIKSDCIVILPAQSNSPKADETFLIQRIKFNDSESLIIEKLKAAVKEIITKTHTSNIAPDNEIRITSLNSDDDILIRLGENSLEDDQQMQKFLKLLADASQENMHTNSGCASKIMKLLSEARLTEIKKANADFNRLDLNSMQQTIATMPSVIELRDTINEFHAANITETLNSCDRSQ